MCNFTKLIDSFSSSSGEEQAFALDKFLEFEVCESAKMIADSLNNLDKDDNGALQIKAINTLGFIGRQDVAYVGSTLVELLSHVDDVTRFETLDALAELGYLPAIEKAISLIETDTEWLVRVSAIEALVTLTELNSQKVKDTIDALFKALKDDSSVVVRDYSAWAIAVLGDGRSIPALDECFKGENEERVQAMISLAKLYLGDLNSLETYTRILSRASSETVTPLLNALEDLLSRGAKQLSNEDATLLKEKLHNISEIASENEVAIQRIMAMIDTFKALQS